MSVRLFIGGLDFATTTDELKQAFARFGVVASAAVMTDRETGRSRGFGFVEMLTTEEAERAITGMNGQLLGRRPIRVDKAAPRGSGPVARPAGPGGPRPGGPSRFGAGPGGPRPGGPPRFGGGPGGPRFGAPGRFGSGPGATAPETPEQPGRPARRNPTRKPASPDPRGAPKRRSSRPKSDQGGGGGRGRWSSDGDFHWGR